MLKRGSKYIWGAVVAYVCLALILGERLAGRIMADNFGTIFFGAIGLQIALLIISPFFRKK